MSPTTMFSPVTGSSEGAPALTGSKRWADSISFQDSQLGGILALRKLWLQHELKMVEWDLRESALPTPPDFWLAGQEQV
ncbi:hypothetical protein [Planctomicrobium sp. SH664]|uniref:hypothetical protein n=1 Tax=Planctomicrobium sp. SH664 TaxID=3448125 RepID=UPI003F5B01CE